MPRRFSYALFARCGGHTTLADNQPIVVTPHSQLRIRESEWNTGVHGRLLLLSNLLGWMSCCRSSVPRPRWRLEWHEFPR